MGNHLSFSAMLYYHHVQDIRNPLGRIIFGGRFMDHIGTPLVRDWQVRGTYSLACITRGEGRYFDVLGRSSSLMAGDLVLAFPDIGHRYGPEGSATWDECFIIFDGPIFDLWRAEGLLRPSEPIVRLEDEGRAWCANVLSEMDTLQEKPSLTQFQIFVAAMLEPFSDMRYKGEQALPEWFVAACDRLDRLREKIDIEQVSGEVGISERTFRRQFFRLSGLTPQQYRDQLRLRTATELLTYAPEMKLRSVATQVGFADEFYFSKWFKRKTGVTPHSWRNRENLDRFPGSNASVDSSPTV